MSDPRMMDSLQANMARKSTLIDQVRYLPDVPQFSFLDINPTELCNRACAFCPRMDPEAYPSQPLHLSLALTEKIASELASCRWDGVVNLCGYGEPLLHPDLGAVARILTVRGIHVEVTTNGDPLTPETIRALQEAGLRKLVVSLYDGPHQYDHFERIRCEADVPEDFLVLRGRWGTAEDDYGLMPTNRGGSIDLGRRNPYGAAPCYYPCYSMTIDWNGDVLVCMQDWHKIVRMGNVHDQSLQEIWTGRNYEQYRRRLLDGRRSELTPCRHCDAHGRRHGEAHALAWKRWHADCDEDNA